MYIDAVLIEPNEGIATSAFAGLGRRCKLDVHAAKSKVMVVKTKPSFDCSVREEPLEVVSKFLYLTVVIGC